MNGLELDLVQLAIPAIVSALIVAARQFSARFDGPAAYWWSIGVNIVAQVAAELATGDGSGMVAAATLGLGTGAIVSPGLAATGKRIGAGKLVKPRQHVPMNPAPR